MRASLPLFASACVALLSIGCGSSSDGSPSMTGEDVTGGEKGGDAGGEMSGGETGDGGSEAYVEPAGLTGTPGTMPCEPFDSGFEGDDLCIKPPPDGTGLHMHVGPDDYDDPAQIEEFVMQPGDESVEYYRFNADHGVLFYKQHYRLRPGSHHLIIYALNEPVPEESQGWGGRDDLGSGDTIPIGGTQRSVSDFPPDGEVPEEDANLARPIGDGQGLSFEMHYINATDQPILREAWLNFMENDSEQIQILGGLFMIGTHFSVPPGASQVLNYTTELSQDEGDKRVVSIFGHRHANTGRFSAWVHHDGERTLVYEDYNWDEPAELTYNTVIDNGDPDPATGTPGGYSGMLELVPGDQIEWECEVHNHQDVTLEFGNEVYTGEMCNLFGSTAGGASPVWFARPDLVVKEQ